MSASRHCRTVTSPETPAPPRAGASVRLRQRIATLGFGVGLALGVAGGLLVPVGGAAQEVFSDDEFVIVGEILKPEITVVISRENLNKAYDLKLEESFLDRILQSVEQDPF